MRCPSNGATTSKAIEQMLTLSVADFSSACVDRVGSEAYVDDAWARGENILGVINMDMNGWAGNASPDPENLDGVASGAIFGNSLYVNNARYFDFPGLPTEYWITKLNIYDVE